ncbi:MAG TPA: hypothetical protein DCR24_03315 [Bacillus bacterium]|nr:hypothetical protein [Bacillus sp. (in: firmicutes)]
MSQRIIITNAFIENNELMLTAESEIEIADLTATGQMLVDSDHFSFIYIVENEGSYQYISIPELVWNVIQEGLAAGLNANLAANGKMLSLKGFHEEMKYLIANISGNSNYGEEMVAKVEQIFTTHSA